MFLLDVFIVELVPNMCIVFNSSNKHETNMVNQNRREMSKVVFGCSLQKAIGKVVHLANSGGGT